MEYPKLRAGIEAFPAQMATRPGVGLRDTQGFTDQVVFLPAEAFPIIRLFDGQHSLVDIQADIMKGGGGILTREEIERLVGQLDEGLFLDSQSFRNYREKLVSEFRASPTRAAALAGRSYSADPEQLKSDFDKYFLLPEGPGPVGENRSSERLKGVVIPHIDYPRGGAVYAWAYKEIIERSFADVYIMLGTAHVMTENPYVLTGKNFGTPLGVMRADEELVGLISRECGPEVYSDELAHRSEHSVELQAVFLKYALGERDGAAILPVLCGSFHQYITDNTAPEDDPGVGKFISTLRKYIEETDKSVCIIASADLAHMGPQFGDPEPLESSNFEQMTHDDLELARIVAAGDAGGLFEHIARDNDRRRVCGFPSIYTMLKVIEPCQGRLLKYSQWPDANATVTFASMIFI